MFNNIPENIKTAFASVAPLVVVLFLFLIVGNFGISKISDLRSQIEKAQNDQNLLSQKLSVLQSLSASLQNIQDLATGALPSGNSALPAISQLKSLAIANSVFLSNIKATGGTSDASGLSRAGISFDATGTREQIIAFLDATGTVAPIIVVNSIKLSESGGVLTSSVSVNSFWSPFPTKLPAVTQSLTGLSPSENTILTSIATLKQPTFSVLPPVSGGRTDPFGP